MAAVPPAAACMHLLPAAPACRCITTALPWHAVTPIALMRGTLCARCRQLAADVAAAAEQLGLDAGETVLESFACRLLQSYTSVSNFFTPVQQVGWLLCLL